MTDLGIKEGRYDDTPTVKDSKKKETKINYPELCIKDVKKVSGLKDYGQGEEFYAIVKLRREWCQEGSRYAYDDKDKNKTEAGYSVMSIKISDEPVEEEKKEIAKGKGDIGADLEEFLKGQKDKD